ncbi:MAG TPA: tyrosine-type recombinase/integrase [Bacteroidales bacterium]|nr:tyrosine-type recombinase/integrase [Bacteroidales bacterium]
MSVKFSQTTADYLEWNEAMNLIRKLYDDKKYTLSLYIACSCFFGLRASDTLSLRWDDLLGKDEFQLVEKKTKKQRDIKINQQLKKHIWDCYNRIKPASMNDFAFISQKGTVFSLQRLNVILKDLKKQYNLKIKNFSTHSFRKAFGREIFNRSGSNAELSLVRLSQLFNHSNPAITRRYLGIAKEELMETYDILSF